MKKTITKIALLSCIFFTVPLFAGITDFAELGEPAKKCELIVIATPLGSRDTGESFTLPYIHPRTDLPGVETRFKPLVVLKGSLATPEFTLHHYRLPKPQDRKHICIASALVSFPFPDETFIMFLNKESDGRYAAYSGQVEPKLSIRPLADESWAYDRGYVFTGNRSYLFFMGLSAILLVLLVAMTFYVGILLRRIR